MRFPYSLQEQTPFSWSKSRNRRPLSQATFLTEITQKYGIFLRTKSLFLSSLKKQPIFHDATTKWRYRAMTAEIPSYWWRSLTQICWLDETNFSRVMNNQKHYLDLSSDVISMEFLQTLPRRHFAGKPVVALSNVVCFFRLLLQIGSKTLKLTSILFVVVLASGK